MGCGGGGAGGGGGGRRLQEMRVSMEAGGLSQSPGSTEHKRR